MEFDLSKPQKLLKDSAREFLNRHCKSKRVRELMSTEWANDDELWQAMVDQGWTGLVIPRVRRIGSRTVGPGSSLRGDGARLFARSFSSNSIQHRVNRSRCFRKTESRIPRSDCRRFAKNDCRP